MSEPGKNRLWGYASYYEDENGETRLIYTSYEKDGSVNRYTDNGDGGHGHARWESKEDFDAGEDPDWSRQESNSSDNPETGEIQENGGCYLTTACMHKYKENFDDNCYELTTLRWFRDNYVTLFDKMYYYRVAPTIVRNIERSKRREKYYKYIYESIVKPCVEAIESGNYKFAYNRYKRTIELLENQFTIIKEENKNINVRQVCEGKNILEGNQERNLNKGH